VEPAATNLALHSRDLTNAVWSGTTVTTAKNAVGADGVASGATTITATAASGTVLQALSHASQSRVFSAYIRRVTGTGAIQLTTNGGTNWTTVTISSLYTQVACAAQTVASGTIGIRLAVSGDVIEVDFTQGEVGPVATSPIATTIATGTRNAEVVTLSGAVSGCIGQTEGTIYAEVDIRTFANVGFIASISDGTASNRVDIYKFTDSKIYFDRISSTQSAATGLGSAALTAGIFKVAVAYKSGDTTMYINGTQVGATQTQTFAFSSIIKVNVGSSRSDAQAFNDRIRSAALYTTRLTNAELAALTTL
jgi:hypothetical protein